MKNELIKFLRSKTTDFTVDEVLQMIQIIGALEDPKPKEAKKKKK